MNVPGAHLGWGFGLMAWDPSAWALLLTGPSIGCLFCEAMAGHWWHMAVCWRQRKRSVMLSCEHIVLAPASAGLMWICMAVTRRTAV